MRSTIGRRLAGDCYSKQAGVVRTAIKPTRLNGIDAIQHARRSGLNKLFRGDILRDPEVQKVLALRLLAYKHKLARNDLFRMTGEAAKYSPDNPDDVTAAAGAALQQARPRYFTALSSEAIDTQPQKKMLAMLDRHLASRASKSRILLADPHEGPAEYDEPEDTEEVEESQEKAAMVHWLVDGCYYTPKQANIMHQLNPAIGGGLLGAAVGGIGSITNADFATKDKLEKRERNRAIILSALLGGSMGAVGGLAASNYGQLHPLQPPRIDPSLLPEIPNAGH